MSSKLVARVTALETKISEPASSLKGGPVNPSDTVRTNGSIG